MFPQATNSDQAKALGFSDYAAYQQAAAQWNDEGKIASNVPSNIAAQLNIANNPLALAKQAQQLQLQANQPAIATLQGQETSLSDQYAQLLQSVLGQGSAAMNTATSGENAYLGQRGLLSQAGLGNTQLSQAQQTVGASNQAAAAQVGMGSAQDINTLAQTIASLQAGNVPGALTFSNNLANTQAGITNTNTTAQEALQAAKLNASEPYNTSGQVFNPSTLKFLNNGGGVGGGGDTVSEAIRMLQTKKSSQKPAASISRFVQ